MGWFDDQGIDINAPFSGESLGLQEGGAPPPPSFEDARQIASEYGATLGDTETSDYDAWASGQMSEDEFRRRQAARGASGGNGGGGSDLVPLSASFAAPAPYQKFTEQFAAPTAPTDLMDKWDRTFSFTGEDLPNDSGAKYRADQVQKGIERSAASKGNLFTGGTAVNLADELGGLASQEFNNAFDRALTTYRTDYDTFAGDRARRSGEFDKTYGRAKGEYDTRYAIHSGDELNRFQTERTNRMDSFGIADADRQFGEGARLNNFNMERTTKNDDFDHLFRFADYGYGAASGGANLAANAGRSGSDVIQNVGNAQAAGTIGRGNAWQTGLGAVSDLAQTALLSDVFKRRGAGRGAA